MAINNIDSQFASARAEVRALIKYCNPNTNIGGQSIEVLQSIVDTLDAVQGVHDALQDIDASTSNVGITLAVLDQCAYFCTSVGELSVDVVDSHLRAPPRDLELQ